MYVQIVDEGYRDKCSQIIHPGLALRFLKFMLSRLDLNSISIPLYIYIFYLEIYMHICKGYLLATVSYSYLVAGRSSCSQIPVKAKWKPSISATLEVQNIHKHSWNQMKRLSFNGLAPWLSINSYALMANAWSCVRILILMCINIDVYDCLYEY